MVEGRRVVEGGGWLKGGGNWLKGWRRVVEGKRKVVGRVEEGG